MHIRSRPSLLVPFWLACTLTLAACPKEQSAQTSAEQEPPAPARFSGVTASFVQGLSSLKAYAHTVDDAGAAVVYEEIDFTEDGNFSAKTSIRLGDEPFACKESGDWTLEGDRADSKESAALTLEVTSTDCAGRSAPSSFRVRAQLQDDEIRLSDI